MLCIGHRGAMGHEPENTLLSVRKALALGVDGVEIDVYNIEDNLIVIHDRNLSRTTNGIGYLEEHSFDYVRSLDAGKGEQIPTLREVLDTVDRQAIINIELKGNNTARLVVDLIAEYLNQGWSKSDFVVSSFNHYELHLFTTLCPQVTTGMLIYGLPWSYIATAQKLQADIIIVAIDYVSPELINKVHRHNLPVWVYTVNQSHDINRLRALQVDGIFTNYPERVILNSSN